MEVMRDELHVVLGASGGIGGAVVRALVAQGARVRGVTRSGKGDVPANVEMVAADVSNHEQMRAACAGASVVYFCANPPYTDWPRAFPPMLEGAIAGAAASGAKLVAAANLYVYAPTTQPLTEDMPWRPVTRKGKVRAAMDERLMAAHRAGEVRATIGRASDYFGPSAPNTSVLGQQFFSEYLAGKTVNWVGNLDVPHSANYVEDVGRGLVTLGQHDMALGQAWHIPAAPALTGRELLELVFAAGGHRARMRAAPRLMLQALGLFNPLLREVAEMAYQFEQPFILDGSKFIRAFGGAPMPMPEAVAATVAWYRQRTGGAG